jgi:hypothetical protein
MSFSKAWLAAPALCIALIVAAALGGGCSSNSNGSGSSGSGSGGASGPGICLSSCDKPCGADSDCDTSNGELCCDYGSAGKVCQNAKSCPKFCGSDQDCMTSMGQACEKVSLSSPVTICEQASSGLKTCQVDTDCPGNNEVCCTIYKTGLCTAANECPKSCTSSSSCNTTNGEVCCTTAAKVDPSITAPGLCLNPQYAPCPKACATDSDCSSTSQLCCNGVCSATCPKSCNQSSDCDQQICCSSYKASLPPGPVLFHTGPTCTGTPLYTTCQQCSTSRGSCSYCPGCGVEGGTGYCQGSTYTCAYCGTNYNCTCPGCTAGGLSCSGTALSCANYFDQATCTAAGCTWPDGGTFCSGVPTQCTSLTTQTTCQAQSGCTWSTSCTGTPTSCSLLTTLTTCDSQPGCSFYSTTGACTGALTPCDQLTPSQCSLQTGCTLTQ